MSAARRTFEVLIARLLEANDEILLNEGPEEQLAEALKRFDKFTAHTPLEPCFGSINLFGFGQVSTRFRSNEDEYFFLSEAAESMGWSPTRAFAWADSEVDFVTREQRWADEERGDGLLGWDGMRDYFNLGLEFIHDDPEAKPDADDRRWGHGGEFLISTDRIMAMLSSSNWGKEFMDNSMDALGYAFKATLGASLDPAAKALFSSDLTEEEAFRKAIRGPALDLDGDD
jgi:hypothetical protein